MKHIFGLLFIIFLSSSIEQTEYWLIDASKTPNESQHKKKLHLTALKSKAKQIKILHTKLLNYRKFPKELQYLTELEHANFQTSNGIISVNWYGAPCEAFYTFKKSKVSKIPEWFNKYKKLKTLNLLGHNKINYEKEVKNLLELKTLKHLKIQVKFLKNNVIDVLNQNMNLDTLSIGSVNYLTKEVDSINKINAYKFHINFVKIRKSKN